MKLFKFILSHPHASRIPVMCVILYFCKNKNTQSSHFYLFFIPRFMIHCHMRFDSVFVQIKIGNAHIESFQPDFSAILVQNLTFLNAL